MNAEPRDLLAEWLALGREVLERYYPEATGGALYIFLSGDTPPTRLSLPASVSSVAHSRSSEPLP